MEETRQLIEDFSKQNSKLTSKITEIDDKIAEEESLQKLLEFELSQMKISLNKLKQDLSKLDKEKERLTVNLSRAKCLHRQFANYQELNELRVEIKNKQMVKMHNKLHTLDFAIESAEAGPSSSDNYQFSSAYE